MPWFDPRWRIALWGGGLALAGLVGCPGPAPTPPPAPSAVPPPVPSTPAPSAALGALTGVVNPSASAVAGDGGAPPVPDAGGAPAVEDPGPEVLLYIETPYKLEEQPPPSSQEAYKADIMDRRKWNSGGLGELLDKPPGVEGHPDPRVIVNLDDVSGGVEEKTLVRVARKYHWINVVRCYRLGAYKDRYLRGWTKGTLLVAKNGRVKKATFGSTELKNDDVARCIIDKLRTIEFPPAQRETRAKVSVRVGPGDEPMPPPKDLIVPGDGIMPLEAMRQGVRAGEEAILKCYRDAFAYAPGLWGRIILRFHVTKYGKTDEAFEAGSRFPDAHVAQCVVHAARELKFPRPDGGDVRFVVPIRLWNDGAGVERPDPPRDRDIANPQ